MAQEPVEETRCDGCKKPKSGAGIIRFREEFNKYLCSKCCHRAMGDYDKICCKCDKNNADGSFEMKQYKGKDMCADCIEKEERKRKRREARKLKIKLTIKNFVKDHYWKMISLGVAISLAIYFSN